MDFAKKTQQDKFSISRLERVLKPKKKRQGLPDQNSSCHEGPVKWATTRKVQPFPTVLIFEKATNRWQFGSKVLPKRFSPPPDFWNIFFNLKVLLLTLIQKKTAKKSLSHGKELIFVKKTRHVKWLTCDRGFVFFFWKIYPEYFYVLPEKPLERFLLHRKQLIFRVSCKVAGKVRVHYIFSHSVVHFVCCYCLEFLQSDIFFKNKTVL